MTKYKFLVFHIFLIIHISVNAQEIYSKAYGDPGGIPIIYLHGGPGYNSVVFEVGTAKKIADEGLYVIVYDRRGEGRSENLKAQFTFQQTFDDLLSIYSKYQLKKAHLIGHSFGGVVGTLFSEKHPERTESLILVGAPVSLQETFRTIIKSCKKIYSEKNDSIGLRNIELIEKIDTTSLMYSSYCFTNAMNNGFYSPKKPEVEAQEIYKKLKNDSLVKKWGSNMTFQGPMGFWNQEKYTVINLSSKLTNLKKSGLKILGLYGKEDGLYSVEQIKQLENILGPENLKYLDNCSHNVFNDQQSMSIIILKNWIKSN